MEGSLAPHNIDAEEAVLGSFLIEGRKLVDFLVADDFYAQPTRLIFKACQDLKSINQITVAQKLNDMGLLEKAGGAAYLSHLISSVPTSLDCRHYAEIVKRLSQHRRLINLADTGDFDGVAKVLREANKAPDILKPKDIADEMMAMMDTLKRGSRGLSWGFIDLDRITAGLYPDDLVVVGARPSVGKTHLMLQVALNIAKKGKIVLFASIEMQVRKLLERIIGMETDISIFSLRRQNLDDDDWGSVANVAGKLADLPLYLLPSNK